MTDYEMLPVPATQCVFFPVHTRLNPLPKQDVQTKLRDTYKKMGDEFMTNRIATQAKVCQTVCVQRKKNPPLTVAFKFQRAAVGSVL